MSTYKTSYISLLQNDNYLTLSAYKSSLVYSSHLPDFIYILSAKKTHSLYIYMKKAHTCIYMYYVFGSTGV
jgi:hypothetical protein